MGQETQAIVWFYRPKADRNIGGKKLGVDGEATQAIQFPKVRINTEINEYHWNSLLEMVLETERN